eukprot:2550498-Ditylum_brightwellii.AAC.1
MQILLKGRGQAQGNSAQMESLQAESSGRLAPLRFLVRKNTMAPEEDNKQSNNIPEPKLQYTNGNRGINRRTSNTI